MIPGHEWVRCETSGRARQSFWTKDVPQDDTLGSQQTSHSHSSSLFQSIWAETQQPCSLYFRILLPRLSMSVRDLHLPVVSHTENAEEEGKSVVLGLPKLYSVYSTHHDDFSGATESRRQGRKHGNQQVHTAVVGVRRGGMTFQPEDGGTICPDQSDRNSIPTGTGDGEDVRDHETLGG